MTFCNSIALSHSALIHTALVPGGVTFLNSIALSRPASVQVLVESGVTGTIAADLVKVVAPALHALYYRQLSADEDDDDDDDDDGFVLSL